MVGQGGALDDVVVQDDVEGDCRAGDGQGARLASARCRLFLGEQLEADALGKALQAGLADEAPLLLDACQGETETDERTAGALTLTRPRMASRRFSLSSSPARAAPSPSRPATARPMSKAAPMPRAPMAAAVEGLSKLKAPMEEWPSMAEVAGDFLTCWGDDLGPRGEKAAWAGLEKGVETDGVAAATSCEGVRPCCEGACFMGVGVDMARDDETETETETDEGGGSRLRATPRLRARHVAGPGHRGARHGRQRRRTADSDAEASREAFVMQRRRGCSSLRGTDGMYRSLAGNVGEEKGAGGSRDACLANQPPRY